MLQLFYADISRLSPEAGEPSLSADRRARLRCLRNELKRRQSLGAELLLLRALEERGENLPPPLRIARTLEGKPYFLDSALQFNLSHSGHFSACALSERPVGLDIETGRRYREAVAQRCFTPRERKVLSDAADPDYAFSMLWTLKESFLKATGSGLRRPMRELELCFDPEKGIARHEDAWLWHACADDCHFSLCVPGTQIAEKPIFKRIKLL